MKSDCTITKEMTIAEAMEICSRAPEILSAHGMGCSCCAIASSETIEEGASTHGVDIQALLDELNTCVCEE